MSTARRVKYAYTFEQDIIGSNLGNGDLLYLKVSRLATHTKKKGESTPRQSVVHTYTAHTW